MASSVEALISRVKATSDYYAILGVPRDASSADITKAYRKLALKLHPDKCSLEGGTDAFKAVSNAFSVLKDEEKRKHYDRFGSEGPAVQGGGAGAPEDMEELFRQMFRDHPAFRNGGAGFRGFPGASGATAGGMPHGAPFFFTTMPGGGGGGPGVQPIRLPPALSALFRFIPLQLAIPMFLFLLVFLFAKIVAFFSTRALYFAPLFIFPVPNRIRTAGFLCVVVAGMLGFI
mmetsp:Transcript_24250/g.71218  ORF Transcript_24250/g.71218 Transcript_24250/m.71218 type:complete len:231 (-) Transcript_24250:251-943(-)